MPIPESTLDRWAAAVPPGQSSHTYEVIKAAFSRHPWPNDMSHDVYLQGSYRNDTNIRQDSDIDVVMELTSAFHLDNAALPEYARAAHSNAFPNATHSLEDFYPETVNVLRQEFGHHQISVGNKAVRVEAAGGRLPADIVVCQTYRRYTNQAHYHRGVTFRTRRENRQVINFPKQHYDNGVAKNNSTIGQFKPTVRMIKRARNHMADRGTFDKDQAPSYCIECLLHNVPSAAFHRNRTATFTDILAWLANANLEHFCCQNGIQDLFGPSPDQWSVSSAYDLIRALLNLWQTWR